MAERLGADCKVYYGAQGASDGTTLITKVKDVDMSLDATEVDRTTRDDEGWRSKRQGLKGWGVNFKKNYDPADTSFQALKNAFMGGYSIGCAVLDQSSANSGQGIHGKVWVTKFTRMEPLDDVVQVDVVLVGDGKPTWD